MVPHQYSVADAAMTARPIRGLGEIALRVRDLDGMRVFYERVVGLEPLRDLPGIAFFRIAPGVAGHTRVLALFDRGDRLGEDAPIANRTTLDHLASGIELADFAPELARLRGLGLAVTTTEHRWIGWRSLYFADPEGNTVEFVCYDPAI